MGYRTIKEIEDDIREEMSFALKKDPIQPKDFLKAVKISVEHALRLTDYMNYNLDYKGFDGRINEALLKAIREGDYRFSIWYT